ncbi:MAG: MASE3 domain-containing protein [Armatimonadota bacterium]|jgi:signal transduction histidine kinase
MARAGLSNPGGIILGAVAALVLFAGLYIAQTHSYLLFHSLVEIFSIAVAGAVFMLAWNSRQFVDRHLLLWIGVGYLFVAVLDLVHTLAYSGMGVFPNGGVNPPTQLWVAARYMQAIVLVTAPLFLTRRLRARRAFAGFAGLTALVLLSIFTWDIFPEAWSETAGGLTPFKIISEYIICALLLAAIVWLLAWRDRLDGTMLGLLVGSILATLAAELSFTLYTDPYGFPNLVGHYLKLIAFYLIYKAVVEAGLRRPYEVLFRDLKQREEELERSQAELEALNETLEERVTERTAQVRALARELAEAENRERERLASILHDDLQQILAAARMRVKMASGSPDSFNELLGAADENLSEAIERSRSLAMEMSPAIVREQGLGPALTWLAEHMRDLHGLNVAVERTEELNLADPDVEALVFRVVRELLFNVVKHAGVDRASICTEINGVGELCVTVSDDGCGFNPDEACSVSEEGFGLASVRNRLEVLGGRCEISSSPGEGTTVTLVVPDAGD